MNSKNTSVLYNAMVYGALIGVVLIIYSLLQYILGVDMYNQKAVLPKILGYISWLIILAAIIWFTKKYRDETLGGFITYGKALGFGTMLGLCSGILVALYTLIFIKFIDPGVIQYIIDITEQSLESQNMPAAQMKTAMDMTKKMLIPMMIIGSVFGNTMVAFIISLITSIFLKKEQSGFQETMKEVNP